MTDTRDPDSTTIGTTGVPTTVDSPEKTAEAAAKIEAERKRMSEIADKAAVKGINRQHREDRNIFTK